VLGYLRDIHRFPTRDRFAAYNGTAPIEASSGNRKIHRLSQRGNRQLNYVIHIAAVSQIRHHGSTSRTYYHRKINEGMGFPQNREGFGYAAAGWSAVIFSNSAGASIAALLCRRRVL
jgi:hypothetical protein